jgi:Protein of unknown function (DUF3999)
MSRLRPLLVAAAFASFAAAALVAQQANAVFRVERPIVVSGGRVHRLAVDVPLLTQAKAFTVLERRAPEPGDSAATGGLGDLRLFDPSGREVPYLLVSNPPSEPAWRQAEALLPIAPVETEREKTSGFEADLGAATAVDRFRVEGLPPPYLKRVKLEASGDRARWTLLVDEATLFDLPESQLRLTSLNFAAGSYRYFRLTWDDSRSARLPRPTSAAAREVAAAPPAATLTAPVVFERRPSEPRRSRFRLRLPGSRLPIVALAFDVPDGHVMRPVEVYEARLSGFEAAPALLGRGMLKRVEQGSLTAAALDVVIQPPHEPELDVVVDDGDNPPLEVRGITARFAELPWIYFEGDEAIVARYGNGTLTAPRYDLEAVRRTLDITSVPDAAWGEPRQAPEQAQASATEPQAALNGAPIDANSFHFVRDVPPGDAGLIAVRLDAAALAHVSESRFSDLRVIDNDNRQVPYLVERMAEPLSIDTPLEAVERRLPALESVGPATVYRIRWPHERLAAAQLVLTTDARVFRRDVTVAVERPPDRRRRDSWLQVLRTIGWVHADPAQPAAPAVIALPAIAATELLVIVREGDNRPLPMTARILLPLYRVRLYRAQAAGLRLAYGRDELAAPQYDLQLLATRVLGSAATDVVPGPERARRLAPGSAEALVSPRVFWAILVAAVLVLVGVIAKLATKPNVSGESPAG